MVQIQSAKESQFSLHTLFAAYPSRLSTQRLDSGAPGRRYSHWDESATVAENIDRIQRDNVFVKASRFLF